MPQGSGRGHGSRRGCGDGSRPRTAEMTRRGPKRPRVRRRTGAEDTADPREPVVRRAGRRPCARCRMGPGMGCGLASPGQGRQGRMRPPRADGCCAGAGRRPASAGKAWDVARPCARRRTLCGRWGADLRRMVGSGLGAAWRALPDVVCQRRRNFPRRPSFVGELPHPAVRRPRHPYIEPAPRPKLGNDGRTDKKRQRGLCGGSVVSSARQSYGSKSRRPGRLADLRRTVS